MNVCEECQDMKVVLKVIQAGVETIMPCPSCKPVAETDDHPGAR